MDIEEYIYDLCSEFSQASITYHKEKPIIADGFEYNMDKQFDNEIEIRFPIECDGLMKEFITCLIRDLGNDENCDWMGHYSDELMKEYDVLLFWWN